MRNRIYYLFVSIVLLLELTTGCARHGDAALAYFRDDFGFKRSDGTFSVKTILDTHDHFLGDGDSVYRMTPDEKARAWLQAREVLPLPVEGQNLIAWINEQYELELSPPDTCRWEYLNRSDDRSGMPPNASFFFYDEVENALYFIRYDM